MFVLLIKIVNIIVNNNGWMSDIVFQQVFNFIFFCGLDDVFILMFIVWNDICKIYNLNDVFEEIQDNDDMEYVECMVYYIDVENDFYCFCDEFIILLVVDSVVLNGSIVVMVVEMYFEICMINECIVVFCLLENIKCYLLNVIYENENGDKVFISDDYIEIMLEECYV